MFGRHVSVNLWCCKCLCELCTLRLTLTLLAKLFLSGKKKEMTRNMSSFPADSQRWKDMCLWMCVFYGNIIITVVSFCLSGPCHSPSLPSDGTHSRQGETSERRTGTFQNGDYVVCRHFLLLYLHNESQFFYNSRISVVKFNTLTLTLTPTRYLIIITIMLIPFLTCSTV